MLQFLIVFFVMLMVALAFWSISEGRSFTSLDGGLNRGVRVWHQPLTAEMRQFLQTLDGSVHTADQIIRKVDHEVLVVEDRLHWRRRSWYYVAYVNLNAPQSRLEFRMPLSNLVSSLVSLLFVPLLVFALVFQQDEVQLLNLYSVFLFFILLASIMSLLFWHFRERGRILKFLNRSMTEYHPG